MKSRTPAAWSVVMSILLAPLLAPLLAHAQCSNLTGSPAPTTETYGANYVKLKYLMNGPGGGDDRPEVKKSAFSAPSLTFDPLTTHTVHMTARKTSISGTVMWSLSVPPSATLWTQTNLPNGNTRWKYNDPNATFGVKKAQIVGYTGGFFVVTYLRGVNQNIMAAPLIPGTDQLHLLVEIENAGTGICYDGIADTCQGSGNTQICYVP